MGITGNEIRSIRNALGWSIDQFARVLSVHPVTLNRWELAGDAEPKIDGMAFSILLGLKQRILNSPEGMRAAKAEAKETGTEIANLLLLSGLLVALSTLLAFVNSGKRQ